ncbi:alpha/beta fold hydrolase [Actinopolymorpha pittospori]
MPTQSSAARPPAAVIPEPPLGRWYDVDGRRLMLYRSGAGGPAVVFVPGSGLVGLDYLNVHDRVAELTTSVLYDRAGTGWSEPVQLPRTAAEVTDELRDLLHVADVPAPYVLVGHSLGGGYARHYAQRFPDEVAGLLLLDPTHEEMLNRAPEQVVELLAQMKSQELPEATPEQLQAARGPIVELLATWPDSVRDALVDRHLATYRASWEEDKNLYGEVADELRNAPAVPDIPMIVVSAVGHDETQARIWPAELLAEINERKLTSHAELAASVPRGEHRVLDDAGHAWMHEERRDAVLQAIGDLLHLTGKPVRE